MLKQVPIVFMSPVYFFGVKMSIFAAFAAMQENRPPLKSHLTWHLVVPSQPYIARNRLQTAVTSFVTLVFVTFGPEYFFFCVKECFFWCVCDSNAL